MALPSLSTTAATAAAVTTFTSTSISTGSSTTITSAVKATSSLPSLSSSKSASSASYTTPAITVPASSDNPYVSRTTSPTGTVFICFGAIAVFVAILTFVAHIFNSWRARRIALENRRLNFDDEYKGGYNFTPDVPSQQQSYGPGGVPLLKRNESENFNTSFNQPSSLSPYHSHHASITRQADMTRMFISPTAEVLNVRNSSIFADTNGSPLRSNVSQTSLSAYQHSRESSRVGNSSMSPTRGTRPERGRKGKSVIPSMYLDDILGNGDAD